MTLSIAAVCLSGCLFYVKKVKVSNANILALTCVPLLALTDEPEGLWVMLTGSGEESSTAQNIWTQTWLTGLSGDWVTIVTLNTPASK